MSDPSADAGTECRAAPHMRDGDLHGSTHMHPSILDIKGCRTDGVFWFLSLSLAFSSSVCIMVRITTTLPALLASLLHLAQAGPVADAAITPLASLQERDGTCQPVRSTSFPPCTSGVPSVPDSDQNCNPVKSGVYNIAGDPKYTFTEDVYRKAIYLPSSFSTSKKAVILFGGTGLPTYWTYKDTLIARLQADGLNPVWVSYIASFDSSHMDCCRLESLKVGHIGQCAIQPAEMADSRRSGHS